MQKIATEIFKPNPEIQECRCKCRQNIRILRVNVANFKVSENMKKSFFDDIFRRRGPMDILMSGKKLMMRRYSHLKYNFQGSKTQKVIRI